MRVWPIGWASDRQSGQRSSILRTRSIRSRICQGGRCGQGAGLKSRTSTFDSCSWHQPWNARNGHDRPARSSVTVAEWLRRQTVDLSTRVQFPPVTPTMRASFNGENTSVLTKKCRFNSGRLFHCFVSVAQLDESAGFRSPRPLVRFQPLTPDL